MGKRKRNHSKLSVVGPKVNFDIIPTELILEIICNFTSFKDFRNFYMTCRSIFYIVRNNVEYLEMKLSSTKKKREEWFYNFMFCEDYLLVEKYFLDVLHNRKNWAVMRIEPSDHRISFNYYLSGSEQFRKNDKFSGFIRSINSFTINFRYYVSNYILRIEKCRRCWYIWKIYFMDLDITCPCKCYRRNKIEIEVIKYNKSNSLNRREVVSKVTYDYTDPNSIEYTTTEPDVLKEIFSKSNLALNN